MKPSAAGEKARKRPRPTTRTTSIGITTKKGTSTELQLSHKSRSSTATYFELRVFLRLFMCLPSLFATTAWATDRIPARFPTIHEDSTATVIHHHHHQQEQPNAPTVTIQQQKQQLNDLYHYTTPSSTRNMDARKAVIRKQQQEHREGDHQSSRIKSNNQINNESSNGSILLSEASRSTPSSVDTRGTISTSGNDHEIERTFFDWCQDGLGIETILEIQTFQYFDYMKAMSMNEWDDDSTTGASSDAAGSRIRGSGAVLDDDNVISADKLPMIAVRGLAASRDIAIGEVVIRIPHRSLLSVATTIDADSILSVILGPETRRKHGWDIAEDSSSKNNTNNETHFLYEVSLLAIALLYHKGLGQDSSLYHYVEILKRTPIDSMPFLWSRRKLKLSTTASIHKVARGVRRDMQEMYEIVLMVLIEEFPHFFDPNNVRSQNPPYWLYSYEEFQWAFAIVNSRHWQLPIEDFQLMSQNQSVSNSSPPSMDELSPPAATPTNVWVMEHVDNDSKGEQQKTMKQRMEQTLDRSFLAPVADLLNFGPPCTRGKYNLTTHSFEIVASCNFRKGQEVTFWYSDECEDVMVAVYGFMHPMIPRCLTVDDYRSQSEYWRNRALILGERLGIISEDLDYMKDELVQVENVLDRCDCCLYDKRVRVDRRVNREPTINGGTRRHHHENPSVRGSKHLPQTHHHHHQYHSVTGPDDRHGVRGEFDPEF